jgi:cysteine-S-conjugate beta-lyase
MIANTFAFDSVIDRRNTGSMKWDKYKGRNIIPLWVADMDFQSPPAVLDALHQQVDHGIFGYALAPEALIEAVIIRLDRKFQWKVHPDWIVWLPGLVSGLNVTCRAIGDVHDSIMTAVPIYPPFLTAPLHFNRNLITFPLNLVDEKWGFDFDLLEKTVTPRSRLFMLCNPHNPVGRVFTQNELLKLAEICDKHDMIVCSDEIHCDLILDSDKQHIPLATLGKDIQDRTITLMAPSKTYNIAGLGCSFAVISNEKIRKLFIRAMAGIVPHVNLLAYTAALAAYRDSSDWLDQLLLHLKENRNRVYSAVSQMKDLITYPVEATYLAWIDTRNTGLDHPHHFFEKAGVGLSDGAEFGAPGFLRLNFGCPKATLDEALYRMQHAGENLPDWG